MISIKPVTGLGRIATKLAIIVRVFFYVLPSLFTRVSPWRFVQLLRRLLFFLTMFDTNKFVKIDGKTKLDLYLPGFPSKAFLRSCEKLYAFDEKMPCLTVLMSVTSACKYRCEHCYQKEDKGKDIPIERLVETAEKLQDMGVTFFNLEGGDPFLTWDRLHTLCSAIDDRSEIWVNTTGDGVTKERLDALTLTPVSALMFSLRSPTPERFDELFGKPGAWDKCIEAVEMCHKAGLAVTFNSCLSRGDFFDGTFEAVIEKAKELGGAMLQLIHPKNAGGWLEDGVVPFSKEDIEQIKAKVHMYNKDARYRDYPSILAQIIEEDKDHLGCTAGGVDRFYINAKGDLQPCEFLNISFGNIVTDDFDEIYQKMRDVFSPASTCWVCEKYSKKVAELYNEHNLDRLPLSPALSEEVYKGWDLGEPTPSYKRIREMK